MKAMLLVALSSLMLCGLASAQEGGAKLEDTLQADTGAFGPELRPEVRRRFDELRRRRMVDYLKLDRRQAEILERELSEFQRKQAGLRSERQRLLAELRRSVESGDRGKGALEDRLEALHRNQEARERAVLDLRQRLARDLTVEQQAKLQLFAERFGRQLEEGARRIRQRREGLGFDQRPDRPGRQPARPRRARPPR